MPKFERDTLNREQRVERVKLAQRILDRFLRDLDALDNRARAAQPDGYPAGNDGPRSNDVSNPTLAAVIAREHGSRDHALDAIDKLIRAVDMLNTADDRRARALPPDDDPVDPQDCIVCIRVGMHSDRDTNPKRFSQPNARCTWCAGFWREHKFDPPDWILEKRRAGKRITTADVDLATTERRRAKRKKKR